MNQKDTLFFIEKSEKIFGKWYDFSESVYINNTTNIAIACPLHGKFNITPGNFYKHGCFKCKRHIRTMKLIAKANKKFNYKFDYSKVKIGAKRGEEVIIICPDCGEMKYTLGKHLQSKGGCSYCAPTRKFTEQEIIDMANKKHYNKYIYPSNQYKNIDTKINIICPEHGIFQQTPWNHIRVGQGCPSCLGSKGEKLIYNYLIREGVDFEVQKRFKDCRNKKPLPFDFYISSRNLAIEYDGTPHFRAIDFFGGQKYLETVQKHDKIKTDYCLHKGIHLERITYKENINNRLKELL